MAKNREEVVAHVRQMAIDLGRVPKKFEYLNSYYGAEFDMRKLFGNMTILYTAAGLQTKEEALISNNQVFLKDIADHIEHHQPRAQIVHDPYPESAIISDIHWPFSNRSVVVRFIEYVGDIKPKFVFLNGDAWDMYSHSRFPRSHNVFTPRDEQNLSRTENEKFWIDVKKVSPDSECVQLLGNHDVRPMKKVMEEYPEIEDYVSHYLKKLFTYPDVKTIYDPREEFFLNENTAIFHGYRTKLGDHRDFTLLNTINGHSHVGGVVFRRIRGQTLWELNSGFAGDPEAKGLTYTPQRITNWTPGFGAVTKLGPIFIHL